MEKRRCYGCMKLVEEPVCPHCGCTEDMQNQPHQLPVGTLLRDQYLVGRALGQGGFGITYMGWDTYLDMVVAIKEFYPTSSVNRDCTQSHSVRLHSLDLASHYEASKERFLREAKALAKLRSIPEIVGIQSFFKENDTAYIVMEFIRGTELKHYVARKGGRLSVEETLRILEPVFRALHTVHASGLVHRDISPDNIMLDPMGGAKLLDFGAARDVENPDAEKDMTHSTEAILKHGFAPMEQYRSRGGLGPWTDEYGLCATIYYCLTGKVPPDAPARSMDEAQPDWDQVPDLKPYQRDALEKGMAMKAKDRFGDLEALHDALYEAKTEKKAAPAPEKKAAPARAPKKRSGKAGILIAAIAAAALLLAGGFFLLPEKTEAPQEDVLIQATEEATGAPTAPSTEAPTAPSTEAPTEPSTEAPTEPEAAKEPSEPAPPAAWEDNILMEYPFQYGNGLNTQGVTSVTFLDTLEGKPQYTIDVSEAKDGSVLAWVVDWGNVYIAAEGGINGRNCTGLFNGCQNLMSVTFGKAFHTEQAVSMRQMFRSCISLEQVDVQNLDTRNVIEMTEMFSMHYMKDGKLHYGGSRLKKLDLSTWDVSGVTDMERMFSWCDSLETLEIGSWDVSSVTNMGSMFSCCSNLKTLEIGSWDVSRVNNMAGAFQSCYSLTALDIGDWDVSNVTTMQGMFSSCSSLKMLPISNWDVSNVTSTSWMFNYCPAAAGIAFGSWDVSSVKDFSCMFCWNEDLQQVDVGNWDVSSARDMSQMFSGCRNLRICNVSQWNTACLENVEGMFLNCGKLPVPDISGWDTSKITKFQDFYYAGDRDRNWSLLFG